jgi:hypothetical protein
MSPVNRVLTASLIVAPVLSLAADTLYAVRGWADPAAAIVHILGAVAFTLVLVRVVRGRDDALAAVLLVVGALGVAGDVAYGFNTIHVSLGDTDLVDASGAAVVIKPLGLFFPLMLLLTAVALRRVTIPWATAAIGVAALVWPVAHIADIGWLAVAVNVALVAGFAAVALMRPPALAAGRPVPGSRPDQGAARVR